MIYSLFSMFKVLSFLIIAACIIFFILGFFKDYEEENQSKIEDSHHDFVTENSYE